MVIVYFKVCRPTMQNHLETKYIPSLTLSTSHGEFPWGHTHRLAGEGSAVRVGTMGIRVASSFCNLLVFSARWGLLNTSNWRWSLVSTINLIVQITHSSWWAVMGTLWAKSRLQCLLRLSSRPKAVCLKESTFSVNNGRALPPNPKIFHHSSPFGTSQKALY